MEEPNTISNLMQNLFVEKGANEALLLKASLEIEEFGLCLVNARVKTMMGVMKVGRISS